MGAELRRRDDRAVGVASDSRAGRYCPACFYVLRTDVLLTGSAAAWDRFERYLDTADVEIVGEFFAETPPGPLEAVRQRASQVVAAREGRWP